ncbi:hypothetical protein MKW92_033198 [Papaver armeniacum]|nr:hypothetical protein MKW92_033198 [Papaver armeniacum]
MHELIVYYITRVYPTWEVTCFFVIQGICIALGSIVKKTNLVSYDRFQLHPWISGPLILVFLGVNVSCFYFPPLLRNVIDDRAIANTIYSWILLSRSWQENRLMKSNRQISILCLIS